MQRYILQQNIQRYQQILGQEADEDKRRVVARLLIQAERDYALEEAQLTGVKAAYQIGPESPGSLNDYLKHFRDNLACGPELYLVLDPGPGLRIIDASDAYAAGTMTVRHELHGRNLFEVFPDNPDLAAADGVTHLYASLRTAAETRRPHTMAIQRYDIRDPSGAFVERHWQPVNSPILGDDNRVIALLHHVVDVTRNVLASRAS